MIVGMGNSGGGTTTFYAACYDERIQIAIPSCAVCTYDDSIGAMFHCSSLDGARASVEIMRKAYKKLDAKDNCYHIIGDGGHQFFPEDVWPLVKKYIEEKEMKDEI